MADTFLVALEGLLKGLVQRDDLRRALEERQRQRRIEERRFELAESADRRAERSLSLREGEAQELSGLRQSQERRAERSLKLREGESQELSGLRQSQERRADERLTLDKNRFSFQQTQAAKNPLVEALNRRVGLAKEMKGRGIALTPEEEKQLLTGITPQRATTPRLPDTQFLITEIDKLEEKQATGTLTEREKRKLTDLRERFLNRRPQSEKLSTFGEKLAEINRLSKIPARTTEEDEMLERLIDGLGGSQARSRSGGVIQRQVTLADPDSPTGRSIFSIIRDRETGEEISREKVGDAPATSSRTSRTSPQTLDGILGTLPDTVFERFEDREFFRRGFNAKDRDAIIEEAESVLELGRRHNVSPTELWGQFVTIKYGSGKNVTTIGQLLQSDPTLLRSLREMFFEAENLADSTTGGFAHESWTSPPGASARLPADESSRGQSSGLPDTRTQRRVADEAFDAGRTGLPDSKSPSGDVAGPPSPPSPADAGEFERGAPTRDEMNAAVTQFATHLQSLARGKAIDETQAVRDFRRVLDIAAAGGQEPGRVLQETLASRIRGGGTVKDILPENVLRGMTIATFAVQEAKPDPRKRAQADAAAEQGQATRQRAVQNAETARRLNLLGIQPRE